MTRNDLLAQLAGLRLARIDKSRAPQKPLLLLPFGQLAATCSSTASYQQAAERVSQRSTTSARLWRVLPARQRAVMPSSTWNADRAIDNAH